MPAVFFLYAEGPFLHERICDECVVRKARKMRRENNRESLSFGIDRF